MEFTWLSRYAFHLVATKALRVERFIRGLVNPLFTTLAPQIHKITYAKAVNAALLIESGKMERKASKEATKKPKTRVSFLVGQVREEVMALKVSNGLNWEGQLL